MPSYSLQSQAGILESLERGLVECQHRPYHLYRIQRHQCTTFLECLLLSLLHLEDPNAPSDHGRATQNRSQIAWARLSSFLAHEQESLHRVLQRP